MERQENPEREPLLGFRGWREEVKICGRTIPRSVFITTLILLFIILFVIILYFTTRGSPQITGCGINPALSPSAPLLLISGTSNFSYPRHGETLIKSESKALIDFACPGGSVMVNGTNGTQLMGMVVTASCVLNQQFAIKGQLYEWQEVSCSQPPNATVKKPEKNCTGGEVIQIGFDLGNGSFATVASVCFDPEQEITLYSQFELTASIVPPTNKIAKTFIQDDVYNITMDKWYKIAEQQKTINALLHLAPNSTDYIKNITKNNQQDLHFLSKGHLAARADFLYFAQQNATYRYINTAPQWQTLNANNWENAERDTRNYARKNNVDLQIWTGIFNITTLPDANKTDTYVDLYLYTNNTKLVPVPAFFWKIVYNPKNEKGIALTSFNNPYKNETEIKDGIFCEDISDKVNWLTWKKKSLEDGYSFACTLTEFQKVVNVVPKLKDSGLLL